MRIATSSFGPFDISPLREIVEHIDQYDEGEIIYVEDVPQIEPDTLAAVTSNAISGTELERELHFRQLGEIDEVKEVVSDFGAFKTDADFRDLLDVIQDWCL